MLFIAVLVVTVGATTLVLERVALPLVAMIPLFYILMAVEGFNGATGLRGVINGSWSFLSGASSPEYIVCSGGGSGANFLGSLFIALLIFVIAIFNVIPGLIAIVGLPVGVVMAMVGVPMAAFKKPDMLKYGLMTMSLGMAGLIVAGVVMRLLHVLSCGSW